MPNPVVSSIELWVIVLKLVFDAIVPAGCTEYGVSSTPRVLPAITFPGPIVMCCTPDDSRTPNVALPTTVPLSVTPIRLRAIVESCAPLSTRMPPHCELTITLSVTLERDASSGHGRVVLQSYSHGEYPSMVATILLLITVSFAISIALWQWEKRIH